jgi:hypothetical protein
LHRVTLFCQGSGFLENRATPAPTANTPSLFDRRSTLMVRLGLLLSAVFDIYVYVSFRWNPDNPNAAGLVIIAFADLVLAVVSLIFPKFNLPIVGSSILTTCLLLGDLLSIRFLHITASSFALSLIGLVSFDALLITQFLIGIASLLTGRRHPTIIVESDGRNRDRNQSGG